MQENSLNKLNALGQSIWLDYIRRGLIESGELNRMIEEESLRGMTSNPAIFEKAIVESDEYEGDIVRLAQSHCDATAIYSELSIHDVRHAADVFRSVYESTNGKDGYVSLEVNPHLANDTDGTIEEARQLWEKVDRPNVMIKVPATIYGLPAISQLISEGINVNATLIFGLTRYRQVAESYIDGLELRAAKGESLHRVTSVASFFISRIDSMVDAMLDKLISQGGDKADSAAQLRGKVAIASAVSAYQIYKEIFSTDRFLDMMEKGARPQRVLWASTSTKDPTFSDILYIESLIGPDTVNTVPPDTIEAYRKHGKPELRIESDISGAKRVFEQLEQVGIDIDDVTHRLELEGVEKFNQPFDKLMDTLQQQVDKCKQPAGQL